MLTSILLLLASAHQDPSGLEGHWAGGFRHPDGFVAVSVRFEASPRGHRVRFGLPEYGLSATCDLERDGGRLAWDVADDSGELLASFEGERDGDRLSGRVGGGRIETEVDFDLLRVTPLDDAARGRYAGAYRVDEETTLRIVRVGRALDEVLAVELPSREFFAHLYAVSPTELVAGRGKRPLPETARFVFRLDGEGAVEALELRLGDETLAAAPIPEEELPADARDALPVLAEGLGVERRAVTIDAGDVELAGTLYLPPGVERPCPAVVQLHGSAPTVHTTQWGFYTSICLRSGLAVLAFDKRGCGRSTGTLRRFSVAGSTALFDDLSSDAAAAHAWLRRQEGIDPDRVGLVGGSQAGWIMPLVAGEGRGGCASSSAAAGPRCRRGRRPSTSG